MIKIAQLLLPGLSLGR